MTDETQGKNSAEGKDPKREWKKTLSYCQECEKLLEKREALHEQIRQIEEELHKKIHEQHLMARTSSDVEHDKEVLLTFKEKQREIDHLLDEMEEVNEEHLRFWEGKILEQQPQDKEAYDAFCAAEEQAMDEWLKLRKIKEVSESLVAFLRDLEGIQTSFQGRGFWKTVFGKSPIYALAEKREALEKLLQSSVHTIHQVAPLTDDIHRFRKQFLKQLMELGQHAKRRWNFRWVKQTIPPLIQRFSRLDESCQTLMVQKEEEKKEAQAKIRQCLHIDQKEKNR